MITPNGAVGVAHHVFNRNHHQILTINRSWNWCVTHERWVCTHNPPIFVGPSIHMSQLVLSLSYGVTTWMILKARNPRDQPRTTTYLQTKPSDPLKKKNKTHLAQTDSSEWTFSALAHPKRDTNKMSSVYELNHRCQPFIYMVPECYPPVIRSGSGAKQS